MEALNFVLGVHPGNNTESFASGVGARSATVAYGTNRADWSYIPGGVISGTALIRPDLPELKVWPYFWQQREYVMGGGAENFMFLAQPHRSTTGDRIACAPRSPAASGPAAGPRPDPRRPRGSTRWRGCAPPSVERPYSVFL